MGAGIAFQVAKRFPAAYDVYMKQRESGGLKLGEITFAEVAPLKYIVNANTQFSCGGDKRYVDYEAIAKCFEKVKAMAEVIEGVTGVKLDIVFPMIGAGLAGGNWKIIETIILETIGDEFNKVLYKFP
jgi:O-acetyl-ADP-ribose deacetylase (regulator of RNase III)